VRRKVLIVYGTRPEAVKLAPLVLALKASEDFLPVVCVTAQHRQMLDQFNALFGIEPDFDLDMMQAKQTLTHLTSGVLTGLEVVLASTAPAAVIVQGDTTTTFAAALAAFYQRVPVVHVEAGLRTGDRYSPYPEEINRRLTTQLSALHLAPTATSLGNLLREGVPRSAVFVTGNTVIDALQWVVQRVSEPRDERLIELASDKRRILLVTTHRRESWGEAMRGVARAIRRLSEANRDMLILFPVHKNPVVREAIEPVLEGLANVILLEPLEYDDFAWCLKRSTVVLSDSGGIQEEAPSLGKPVLVLRDNTERPEAVEAGTVRLVGTDEERVFSEVQRIWTDETAHAAMSQAVNPYGDGQAVRRSIAAMRHLLLGTDAGDEFAPSPR
jgi:UDP-N-acetylglucosamine 2-epimerase (non-hydrolysing)